MDVDLGCQLGCRIECWINCWQTVSHFLAWTRKQTALKKWTIEPLPAPKQRPAVRLPFGFGALTGSAENEKSANIWAEEGGTELLLSRNSPCSLSRLGSLDGHNAQCQTSKLASSLANAASPPCISFPTDYSIGCRQCPGLPSDLLSSAESTCNRPPFSQACRLGRVINMQLFK